MHDARYFYSSWRKISVRAVIKRSLYCTRSPSLGHRDSVSLCDRILFGALVTQSRRIKETPCKTGNLLRTSEDIVLRAASRRREMLQRSSEIFRKFELLITPI
ncbi:hypothetical protein FOZ63_002352 [Perkinsus olseni]|uniref:Uncharacterized protein n=1 Tax=Perkinsus olseni TaxID=32597 RepID=A0A7J6Q0K3_PEROL|nr:hypothetical protein FOZ63_002352 [Perkinsus olseni]